MKNSSDKPTDSHMPFIAFMIFILLVMVTCTGREYVYNKQAISERTYKACLDQITKPDSPYYADQLRACQKGN